MSLYDQVKAEMIELLGVSLGTFAVNRLSRMIRRRGATCVSHVRVAVVGDTAQEREYEATRATGCCGFADEEFAFERDGVTLTLRLGFCYGH